MLSRLAQGSDPVPSEAFAAIVRRFGLTLPAVEAICQTEAGVTPVLAQLSAQARTLPFPEATTGRPRDMPGRRA